MFLFYDTETTGFPNPSMHPTHPGQARVCQLAAIKYDNEFNEVGYINSLIKPEGWTIHPGAKAAHGISLEDCTLKGRSINLVMDEFFDLSIDCHVRAGFNIPFDDTMLNIEFMNCQGKLLKSPFPCKQSFCCMTLMTDICRLPFKTKGKRFGQRYKWPKLSEAYLFVTNGEKLEGAHDALNDVRATAKVFKYLLDNGIVKINTEKVIA